MSTVPAHVAHPLQGKHKLSLFNVGATNPEGQDGWQVLPTLNLLTVVWSQVKQVVFVVAQDKQGYAQFSHVAVL